MVAVSSSAIPAQRGWQKVVCITGDTIEVQCIGDEHGRWYVDHNGSYYTMQGTVAVPITSAQRKRHQEIGAARRSRINKLRLQRLAKANPHLFQSKEASRASIASPFEGQRVSFSGNKRCLVILVNFSDKNLNEDSTWELYNRRFNQNGCTDNDLIGSVAEYFHDQSYGIFNLQFDIIGPITVSKPHDYYGRNDNDGYDLHPCELVSEAVRLVDNQVDFARYDWDGDNEVEQVLILYCGSGENSSHNSYDIWPEQWTLEEGKEYFDGDGPVILDGVKINTYTVTPEMYANTARSGIGTICHELSHCFGFPDFYDVSNSGGVGMGYWDLLDTGSYNGPHMRGEVPCGYTAYERWMAGWLTPTELCQPTTIEAMPSLEDEPIAYVVYNGNISNECILIENRQGNRWFNYPGGHGLFVTHVDYDVQAWEDNTVNTDVKHQRMTYFPADNSYSKVGGFGSSQFTGDLYPGTSHVTSITPVWYNDGGSSAHTGELISSITENDGLISFLYDGGSSLSTPVAYEATNITKTGFTASWSPVAGADSYTLKITPNENTDPALLGEAGRTLLLSEDFSGFTVNNDRTDISSSLDNYTNTTGWEGYKVYQQEGAVKVGISTRDGYYLTTPIISSPTEGTITVAVDAKVYTTSSGTADNKTFIVSACDMDEEYFYSIADTELTTEYTTHTLTLGTKNSITAPFRLKFQPAKRAYIKSIKVYDNSPAPIIITGITDNSYTYQAEVQGGSYTYTVQAIIDGVPSPWSNAITVNTNEPTGATPPLRGKYEREPSCFTLTGQRIDPTSSRKRGAPAIYIINGRKVLSFCY